MKHRKERPVMSATQSKDRETIIAELKDEHRLLAEELESIEDGRVLTPMDQIRVKELKKLKLKKKTQLEMLQSE